jgi:hypothetical protein
MKLNCVPASWFMDIVRGFRQAVRFVRDAWAAA